MAWPGEWHHAVLVEGTETVIDWTPAQFVDDPEEARSYPWPRIETRSDAEERWGQASELDEDKRLDRYFHDLDAPLPWEEAREHIPDHATSI